MIKDTAKSSIIVLVTVVVFVGVMWWIFSNVPYQSLFAYLTGLTPTFFLMYSENKRAERERKNWLMRDKDAYLIEFMDSFIHLVQKKGHADIEAKLRDIQPAVLAWGSPTMLKEWSKLSEASDPQDESSSNKKLERLLRAVRYDLGCDDSSLEPGEVLATIMKSGEKEKVLADCKGEIYDYEQPHR